MAKSKRYKQVLSKMDRNIINVLVDSGDIIKSEAAGNTRTISSDLKSSWNVSEPKKTMGTISVKIGSNMEYAPRYELGFVGKDSLGRYFNQKGHYVLSNSFNAHKKNITKLLKKNLLK